RKKAEALLCESERSKSILLLNLPGMAYRCNYEPNWTMQFVSEGCYELTGYTPENFINNRDVGLNDITLPDYHSIIWQNWTRAIEDLVPFRMEYEIITASGEKKWVHETGRGVLDKKGNVVALEGIIIDITDRKTNELKLKYLSEHDPVTGLYNRIYLNDVLLKNLADKEKTNKAVLVMNIKKINSISLTYGYSFSEQIIKELAGKLLSITNDNIKLFQISLERFALFVSDFNDDKELISLCREIFEVMHDTQIINATGCGIGILKIEDLCCDPETVLKNASVAAERIDEHTLFSFCFFDENLKKRVLRETEIENELKAASEDNIDNIYLDYQPLLFSKTGKITGFEALARMRSDSLGILPPLDFIPVAEELLLILPLGLKILRMACKFLKKITAAGYKDIKIAVNVSPIQLLSSTFLQDIIDIIKEIDINPNNLCLEVTESVFMDNFDLINQKLGKLQEMGVSVAIDDFGTGYSSLARERELNMDYLKIDKIFIDKLDYLDSGDAITGDIISMAHKLGHLVVAEGVETERQKEYLLAHGCDYLQGFLFSRPVGPSSALELLKKMNPKSQ
ncbi:MAG: EAL domain-containing protein, partial [Synergistaceae bacterium]|nr:EAL domain-containing protein [Synergistaceae bacterium]